MCSQLIKYVSSKRTETYVYLEGGYRPFPEGEKLENYIIELNIMP